MPSSASDLDIAQRALARSVIAGMPDVTASLRKLHVVGMTTLTRPSDIDAVKRFLFNRRHFPWGNTGDLDILT